MNTDFAIDYIPRRMNELGFGNQYVTRWRHFQIDASDSLHIDADNEFFMLIDPDQSFSVRSKFGVYDMSDTAINEMQYEHRGKIDILNKTTQIIMVLFIQVIPNHKI